MMGINIRRSINIGAENVNLQVGSLNQIRHNFDLQPFTLPVGIASLKIGCM